MTSRKETKMKKITAVVLAVSLGGCANIDMTGEEMLGTMAGAAAGGAIGYSLGGSTFISSLFAVGGGAVGGTSGFLVTRALRGGDLAAYDETAQKGLASAKDGQILDWQNPETGNSGIFRPVRSFHTADGRLCRQYRATVAFPKDVVSGVGMACQGTDGRWQIVSDDFTTQG